MDAMSDPLIDEVVMMTSAQVGKTLIAKAIIGFFVDQDPAPILIVQPTIEMGETFSKDRLAPMVRDTPCLRTKIADPKSRDSGNTILHKRFPGGHLTIAGSNSPASLASRPIRVLICDEVDRFPPSAGSEGDPVNLAKARTKTFWNRKIFLCSTPTDANTSRIAVAYEQSNQSRYFVPCPHCGERQSLSWQNVKWIDGDHETASYACGKCGTAWTESERLAAIKKGHWVAEYPKRRIAGFHLSELYSPWRKLSDVVQSFLLAKGKPETLKAWVNTSLGEVWEDREGEQADPDILMQRRESYTKDSLPESVVVVVAGIDVQDDRIEIEFKGFREGEESWAIDHVRLEGDPGRDELWQRVGDQLARTFQRADGAVLNVSASGLDTGGHYTKQAYAFAKKNAGKVFALKGMAGTGRALVAPGGKIKGSGVRLFIVGTDTAKELILKSRVKISEHGPAFMHYPANDTFGAGYFKQLCSERAVTKYKFGQPYTAWVLPSGARNEALDLNVYALAALHLLRPNFKALSERLKPEATKQVQAAEKPVQEKPKAKPKAGWLNKKSGWLRR